MTTEASDRERQKLAISFTEQSTNLTENFYRVCQITDSFRHTCINTHTETEGQENTNSCKINGSCDSQSNVWQAVSIANQTAGGVNVDEQDVCQCHLGATAGEALAFNTRLNTVQYHKQKTRFIGWLAEGF